MGLQDLDESRIRKAFEKARDESNITEGKLVLITDEHFDAALAFGRDVFTRDEPVYASLQVKWTGGPEKSWRSVLQQKLSLMLINESDGEVMAIRTMCIFKTDDVNDTSDIDDPGWKKVSDFLHYCQKRANISETYCTNEAIRMHAIAVDPKYRGRGLASKIFSAAMLMIRYLELDYVCVFGEASSIAPKKIFEKAGFRTLCDMSYAEYLIDGKQVIFVPGETSETVYGMKLGDNL